MADQGTSDSAGTQETGKKPKNIVLASDGTGNSAGKKNDTNVWRICLAVDRLDAKDDQGQPLEQVFFYDDGVGTESFKPLRLLTGAFGVGVSENIRDLYASLVRAYEPGDQIYLFGFSRGAFTVRSLAGLILRCGVVNKRECASDDDLRSKVKLAFQRYRESYYKKQPGLAAAFKADHGVPVTDATGNKTKDVPIQFIGVWDTVGAVGVPFDWLRPVVDRIYPLQFHDQSFSEKVNCGCHALAIDDERQTFHPILWDEGEHRKVHQVWFTGMHSNVGGGYPRQGLAHVTLYWMMQHAYDEGLRFHDDAVEQARIAADVQDKLYDSRSGLAAYYRYLPRDIGALCEKHCHGRLRIHESALDRVEGFSKGYLPTNLPLDGSARLAVEPDTSKAQPSPPARLPAALSAAAATWRSEQDGVTRVVTYRRWLYLCLLLATGLLTFVALYAKFAHVVVEAGPPVSGLGWFGQVVLKLLSPFTPGILDEPLHFILLARPEFWIVSAVVFSGLLVLRGALKSGQAAIGEKMWRAAFPTAFAPGPAAATRRSRGPLRAVAGAGLVALALLVLLTGSLGLEAFGYTHCTASGVTTLHLDAETRSKTLEFSADQPCASAGLRVEEGERYRVTLSSEKDWADWKDKDISASPSGFSSQSQPMLIPFAPLRRVRSEPWFKVMAEVGDETYGIGEDGEIVVKDDGELFLYVNDVLCKICPLSLQPLYGNNKGAAKITIERLDLGG